MAHRGPFAAANDANASTKSFQARVQDLERTFDYEEEGPGSEYDPEEQELQSRIQEMRHQNRLLQDMCSLVLQKSRAAHEENQALLHLIEMLNVVKPCITLNRAPPPPPPTKSVQEPPAQPDPPPQAAAVPPEPNPLSGPPSPTLIAPRLTSHDSVVADAEQDPMCVSPAGMPRQRPRAHPARADDRPPAMRRLDDVWQGGSFELGSQAADRPARMHSAPLRELPEPHRLTMGPPMQRMASTGGAALLGGGERSSLMPAGSLQQAQPMDIQLPTAPSGQLMDLKDTPYGSANTKSLEAVAAAALAHNERHVAGAIIDLLLLGARRRSNSSAT